MQIDFFTIPIKQTAEAQAELNAFLRSRRVLAVERQFVANGENSFWTLAVEHLDEGGDGRERAKGRGGSRIDYMQVLPPDQFAVFAKLRTLRKELAATDGLPPFAVFADAQLAAMVTGRAKCKADLKRIDGVGEGKIEKYGDRFLAILAENRSDTETDKEQ